jgi:hypothetical protein
MFFPAVQMTLDRLPFVTDPASSCTGGPGPGLWRLSSGLIHSTDDSAVRLFPEWGVMLTRLRDGACLFRGSLMIRDLERGHHGT